EADRMVTPQVIGFVPDFGTEGSAVAHLKKHFPDLEIKPDEEAPWSYADAIAKRQYGVERTAWLRTVDQYRGVIAALDVELEKRSRLAALEKQLAEHGLTLDDVETQFPNIRKGWRRHRQTLERLADHYAEGRA
ncbi:MAG: hypothetical protein HLX50_11810, partial [Alteromonadaceae bacterium]|nr:hypothetical protein [Alteromonadaceae bacterium]